MIVSMNRTLLATLLINLMAAPAIAADQFDLVCTAKSDAQRYRIDLVRAEYCFGKCETIRKVQEVTSGMITLYDEKDAVGDGHSYTTINRLSGEWRWFSYTPSTSFRVQNIQGVCEPAPFSGFPEANRKF